MKLSDINKIHMIGIKGTGMSALAIALSDLGKTITGSDAKDSFLLLDKKNYIERKIRISRAFTAKNITKSLDLAIVTTSHYDSKNPEIVEAKKLGVKIITYPMAIAMIMKEIKTVSVAGSHGKTTVTNLIAYILRKNKVPALAVSGPTSQQVIDTKISKEPEYFVAESDEYENKLKYYSPFGVILNNVDHDHPDFFKTKEQYSKVFSDYIKKIPENGFLVYWTDDKNTSDCAIGAKCKKLGYGFSKSADYRIELLPPQKGMTVFTIRFRRERIGTFKSNLLGRHNVLNAAGSILVALGLGLNNREIQHALNTFQGSPRRLEKVSSLPLIYDDYGHHPTEIRATLNALRSTYPNRDILTVFQAHTFTRTKAFLDDFGKAFGDSNHVVVLDIWGSAREDHGTVHAKDIVEKIIKSGTDACYKPTRKEAARYVKKMIKKNSLVLVIGASDIWKIIRLLK